jgi:hypothetical protein
MKAPREWQHELNGETSTQSIWAIQKDALIHAARLVHNMSRGTISEERAIVIDEARDLIIDETKSMP